MENLTVKTLRENACVVEKIVTFTLATEEINELEDALDVVSRYVGQARLKAGIREVFGDFYSQDLKLDHETQQVEITLKVGSIG